MKIDICASGRFHLLDLARELSMHGHSITFYTIVPARRCHEFCDAPIRIVSFFPLLFPLLGLTRIAILPLKFRNIISRIADYLLDVLVSLRISQSDDAIVALSGVFVKTLKKAKVKGVPIILERGSKHILEQAEILAKIPGAKQVMEWDKKRELAGYDIADIISIASIQVAESFYRYGFNPKKFWINPYGVDLSMFPSTVKPKEEDAFDVIMVGGWSYQKGCDLLIKVCQDMHLKLLHVGSIGDLQFPQLPGAVHHNAVDPSLLRDYYAKAKIMVLPSRQEGLALVQAQAVSCGLPLVCSRHTGGVDLRSLLDNTSAIIVTKDDTIESLKDAIKKGLTIADSQPPGGLRDYLGATRERLSWKAYGERYNNNLLSLINEW